MPILKQLVSVGGRMLTFNLRVPLSPPLRVFSERRKSRLVLRLQEAEIAENQSRFYFSLDAFGSFAGANAFRLSLAALVDHDVPVLPALSDLNSHSKCPPPTLSRYHQRQSA